MFGGEDHSTTKRCCTYRGTQVYLTVSSHEAAAAGGASWNIANAQNARAVRVAFVFIVISFYGCWYDAYLS